MTYQADPTLEAFLTVVGVLTLAVSVHGVDQVLIVRNPAKLSWVSGPVRFDREVRQL